VLNIGKSTHSDQIDPKISRLYVEHQMLVKQNCNLNAPKAQSSTQIKNEDLHHSFGSLTNDVFQLKNQPEMLKLFESQNLV